MAVLSKELIGGREAVEMVVYQDTILANSPTEVAWASSTDFSTRDVTLTKAVAADQKDRTVIDTRLAAAARV